MLQLNQPGPARTLVSLMVGVAIVATYQALALGGGAGPAQPAIVATFDLEKTFNAVAEKEQLDQELIKLAEDFEGQKKEKLKSLKQLENELEDLPKGGKKYNELLERLSQDTQYYGAFESFCQSKIDDQRARNWEAIYQRIKDTAGKMAEESHIDVVLVDDSIMPLKHDTTEKVRFQISARRLIYTSNNVDITDALIGRLNQEFAAK